MKRITHKMLEDAGCCDVIDSYFIDQASWSPAKLLEEAISRRAYSSASFGLAAMMSRTQRQQWAISSAKSVLHIFENEYPTDDRPRKAIEAAEAYLADPSKSNAVRADDARPAAGAAAGAASYAAAYAADAAGAAADAASYAAADATVAAVAYAARAAAGAAADAVDAYPDLLRAGLAIYLNASAQHDNGGDD